MRDAPEPSGGSASDRRDVAPSEEGASERYRHSVDLRFTTPPWLGSFYFDLRMGHDQRGGTRPYFVPPSVTRRNRVIASVLIQMAISWCALMALLVVWLFQMGCGAGLGPEISGGGAAGGRGGTGAISVAVAWPEVTAEMIPSAANSVKLVVTRKDTSEELAQTVIPKGTESATLSNLPAGVVCVVTATAHPNPDGTGTAQAKAVQEVTIPDGSDVAVHFTLESVIATVEPAQTELSGQVGGTAQITATAKDDAGNAVLVEQTWTYQSSNPAIASVDPSGVVTFVSVGTVTITITEEESGRSAYVTVECTSPPPLFTDGPPFPRIANLYGSEVANHAISYPARPEFSGTRLEYWSKVDLFAGCGIFYAWNWEARTYSATERAWLADNKAAILASNPHAKFLTYDFVSTYATTSDVQPEWILDAGKRWVNLGNPDAIAYLETKVNQYDVNDFGLDGVFFDEPKWHAFPLAYAAACNVAAGPTQPIVMGNAWNLTTYSALDKTLVNGVLSEDELNRVLLGKPGYSFAATMAEYFEWTAEAKSPRTTIIAVCSPNPYCDGWTYDYTGWKALTEAQQDALILAYKDANPSVFRFGLTATLLGDGYYAYDMGGIRRGVWWWYPEYDAPLGYPTSVASVRGDGAWQREYQGGTVVCNPTSSPVTVDFPAPRRDVSTGTEATSFSVPARDGRLFVFTGS